MGKFITELTGKKNIAFATHHISVQSETLLLDFYRTNESTISIYIGLYIEKT